MSHLTGRKASPITQERLQRLSVYESILNILIEELFYDLEHGGEVEPGKLIAINSHNPNAQHVLCSVSERRFNGDGPVGWRERGN